MMVMTLKETDNSLEPIILSSDLDTHSHSLNGPAVLFTQYADGLLQCFFALFHIRLLLLAVPLLLFNPTTLTRRR